MIEILHRKKAKVESEFFLLIVEREGKVIFSTLSNKSFEKTISIVPCDRFDILDFNPAIDTRFSPRDCERERVLCFSRVQQVAGASYTDRTMT